MGILDSLITLGLVVGGGYVTITYIIPKITGVEFSLPGAEAVTTPTADESVIADIAGVVDPPKEEKKPKGGGGAGGKGKGATTGGKGGKTAAGGKGGKGAKGGKTKGGATEEKTKKEFLYAYFNFGDVELEDENYGYF